MEFKASPDFYSKFVTGICLCVFGALVAKVVSSALSAQHSDITVATVIMLVVILFCLYLTPKSYTLAENALVINRIGSNVSIPYTDINKVSTMADFGGGWSIRLFGIGGLFGYVGIFYNSKVGIYRAYARKRYNRILIVTTQGDKIVITPDDTDMVYNLERKLAAA